MQRDQNKFDHDVEWCSFFYWLLSVHRHLCRLFTCCGGTTSPSSSSLWILSFSSCAKTTIRSLSCTSTTMPQCRTSGGLSWTGCPVDTVSVAERFVSCFKCFLSWFYKCNNAPLSDVLEISTTLTVLNVYSQLLFLNVHVCSVTAGVGNLSCKL